MHFYKERNLEKIYKIGIISDTHGLLRKEVLDILKRCDYIIHGGDIDNESILEELKSIAPLFVVRGNDDKGKWSDNLPEELYFSIGNINFYMIHNKKNANKDLKNVDVAVFGHSHKYFHENIDDIMWINPGSCGKRRFNLPINMAIMTITDKNIEIEKLDISVEYKMKK